jgi:DNA topoisomerase-3
LDSETFERALEQLWVHRGVNISPEENIVRGDSSWERNYLAQTEQRRQQIHKMLAFTSLTKCRMVSLVSHFGDLKDSGLGCGICDVCKPSQAESLVKSRTLSLEEQKIIARMIAILARQNHQAGGRLFQELTESKVSVTRGVFEKLVATLGRAGWVDLSQESFEKDGRMIHYRKLSLTQMGRQSSAAALAALNIAASSSPSKERRQTKSRAKERKSESTTRTTSRNRAPVSLRGYEPLRAWRLEQARKRGIPAFRILTDRALRAICERGPRLKAEILEISGVNRKAVAQYGDDILRVLRSV